MKTSRCSAANVKSTDTRTQDATQRKTVVASTRYSINLHTAYVNCDGEHVAGHPSCQGRQKEDEILKVHKRLKIGKREARRVFRRARDETEICQAGSNTLKNTGNSAQLKWKGI